MPNDMLYELEKAMGGWIAVSSVLNTFHFFLSIAVYVLSSLGFYTIAKRRGINHAWLAWVPVANIWILGSLSDQYRYVTKGQVKNKRKILLTLDLVLLGLTFLFTIVFVVSFIGNIAELILIEAEAEEFFLSILKPMLGFLAVLIIVVGLVIASTVITYMALYDVYMSLDPEHGVLYLVLSIFFGITQPFFVFFNRNKDLGMYVQAPQRPYQAPRQPYQAPRQPYQAPQQPYQAPQQPYQAPQQPYQAPQQPYQAPRQPYQAPQQPYQAPQQPYQAPQQDPNQDTGLQ